MTQEREDVKRIAELNALFLTLDDKGQDSALTLLRSLGFAQSVMCPTKQAEQPCKPSDQMERAPVIVDGCLFLPAREMAEGLGYQVIWNSAASAIEFLEGSQETTDFFV